jgi:acyl-CoA reductase-like NAD-dependent aldehyde dehydrogenase
VSAVDVLVAGVGERSPEADLEPLAACVAARAAQPAWAARSLAERAAVIRDAATLVSRGAEALAIDITDASRRPAAEVWSAEIVPTLDALRWLGRDGAGALRPRRLSGARLQWYFRAARHELMLDPYGVVGIITPANSLLFLAVPQIAAALLVGNGVVWKPAPAGGVVAARVASMFLEAGVPPGAFHVVPGGAEAARAIVLAGVDKLHFTGGTAAGLELYRLQAARGRPAVLELSGRHIAIVLDDADLRLTARGIVWGKLANGGRNCISVQLVLVTRAAAPALLEELSRAMAEAPAAEPAPEEARRLTAILEDAAAAGARLVRPAPWPALVSGVSRGMRVVDEELQGPVLAVAMVDSAEEAARWVNEADHRLSASVWTSSGRGRDLARRLDVGQVWVNDQLHPTAHPEVTLAGRGGSGFGATRGLAGLMEMVQPKVLSETPLGAGRRHYLAGDAATTDLFRATARLGAARGLGNRLGALAMLMRSLGRLARRRP